MMKKFIISFWPIFVILSVWFVFSYPFFLQHKVPFPSAYAVNFFPTWNAYHIYDGPVKNSAMPDVIDQIFPWKIFTIESLKHFQIPLWNPFSFSGTPHLANYQSAVLSPFNLLFFVFSFITAWSILVLLQPLLAGIFTYVYCRSIAISRPASLLSAIAFMFCGFMTTWMDYATLGYAILFLPLALFAIEKFLQTKRIIYGILLSITFPLSFFSGHFQISLYFLLFIFIYLLYKFVMNGFKTLPLRVIVLFLFALSGILLTMPQILPSLEFYQQSLRSNLFQQIEAIPLGYLPTFLAPDFFGNPVTRNDWYGHYAEWNGYIGLLPFMLAFYGVFRKRNRFQMFLFISAICLLLCAFATPVLNGIIALRIPVISTSAASRIIVLFSFLFIILAGFGLDSVIDDIQERRFRPLILWLGIFACLFALLWGVLLAKAFLPLDKIVIAKQNFKLPTLFFFVSCFLISIQLLITQLIQKRLPLPQKNIQKKAKSKKIKQKKSLPKVHTEILVCCLLILVSLDMLRFATKWQPFDPSTFVFPQTPVVTQFPAKEPYERIAGDDWAEIAIPNNLPGIEGYDPLYIKRYGEFASSLNGSMQEASRSLVLYSKDARNTLQAFTLLNVKYILQKNSDNGMPWGFPLLSYPVGQFTQLYNDGVYTVYKNNIPVPHVFLAQNYLVKTIPQDILHSLFIPSTHLDNTVILEEDPHLPVGGVSGSAQITQYLPNTMTLSAKTNKDALLFISEIYYPGWKAYIDGKETPIYRADYTFRSVVVPAGSHTVTFTYEPLSFTIGCWMFVIGLFGIASLSFLTQRKLIQ